MGRIGSIQYRVYDVKGDGHCFYRAMYQILDEISEEIQDRLGIREVDEDTGVANLRYYIAEDIRNKTMEESLITIDTLCMLPEDEQISRSERQNLYRDLRQMYPFVTSSVCSKKGQRRYNEVAAMIERMDPPMYASSLEMEHMKMVLGRHANLTILTIQSNGRRKQESQEQQWYQELSKMMENVVTEYVAVLLNRNNIHYQYMRFWMTDENEEMSRAIFPRVALARLLAMPTLSKISGGTALGRFTTLRSSLWRKGYKDKTQRKKGTQQRKKN